VARALYEQLLTTANLGESVSNLFLKYYKGQWNQPGLGGLATETFPGVTGETDGDFQIVWSSYRNRFIAIVDNSQEIAYGESIDGTYWPPMQVIYTERNLNATVGYANAVGLGDDPGVLGDTFYSYYTDFSVPNSPWQPATLKRMTITTAATMTTLVPLTTAAGSAATTLTVNGEGFVSASAVTWNGEPLATTYVSPTLITAQLPASDLANAGDYSVAVSNPAPCGGQSNAIQFTVTSANTSSK
jgi:hypothetical protein